MKTNPALVNIGTSGWHYPHWAGRFYPNELAKDRWLAFYAEHFSSVEINNTFYKLPAVETVAGWHDAVPDDFVFAVKAPRSITHMHKLQHCDDALASFFGAVEGLGRKLGAVLFQLPPRWHVNVSRLDAFLRLLPDHGQYAFEFRDHSWHVDEVYSTLKEHRCAFCLYDLQEYEPPEVVTTRFVYVRLHGHQRQAYTGPYHPATLQRWARRIKAWQRAGIGAYCYFDNDEAAYATSDARRLCRYLHEDLL